MNDNKSTVMNNAAVQQLRKVPGFDPMKLLAKQFLSKPGTRFGSWISAISGSGSVWPARTGECF